MIKFSTQAYIQPSILGLIDPSKSMQTLASLHLAPGPTTVAEAMAWLESIAEQERWSASLAFKLQLCLDEALTNVVLYGFESCQDKATAASISLAVLAGEEHIVIDIFDNGAPFDPTRNTPAPLAESLDDADIGGHGLRLMHHYLENIEYRRVDQRNHLRLTAAHSS